MTKPLFHFDNSYESLPSIFYKKVGLHPVSHPRLVYLNDALAQALGLDAQRLEREALPVFAGNSFPENASAIAQAYMGHQFGHLTMLGDGRAILVGEQVTPDGNRVDIQLKGSGRTPFSRGGDGRATLYYMLKEYLFSETMHYLGVPSSRSLAVVETGDKVYRPEGDTGAVLTRVASSHIRVGTFAYALHYGDRSSLEALADYTIARHYPELLEAEDKVVLFFDEFLKVQAKVVAKWMALGFVHGVMNTDNTSISGETFDYGPCAFIDTYDLNAVYSSIDRFGRYRYGQQPAILLWNARRFAETLLPLIDENENKAHDRLMVQLNQFPTYFEEAYYGEMIQKLGLFVDDAKSRSLLGQLLRFMEEHKLDYTNTFVDLRRLDFTQEIYQKEDFVTWRQAWVKLMGVQGQTPEEAKKLMESKNPLIVARNYWVEKALEAAESGDRTLFEEFLRELKRPYEDNKEKEKFRESPDNFSYMTYCGT